MLSSGNKFIPRLFSILSIFSTSVFGGCGGGASGEDPLLVRERLLGRWTGTVQLDQGSFCSPTGPDDPADLSGRTYVFDIYPGEFYQPGVLAVDQDGAIYDGLERSIQPDNSFVVDGLNQDSFFFPPLTGPTAVRFRSEDGATGRFLLYVLYNRFCTTRFSGDFTKVGATPSPGPNFAAAVGTWSGNLNLKIDECSLGINPLREIHSISEDALNGAFMKLVSTDRRILDGFRRTVRSLFFEGFRSSIRDRVDYENIADGVADVTVTYSRSDEGVSCSTVWSGKMRLQP